MHRQSIYEDFCFEVSFLGNRGKKKIYGWALIYQGLGFLQTIKQQGFWYLVLSEVGASKGCMGWGYFEDSARLAESPEVSATSWITQRFKPSAASCFSLIQPSQLLQAWGNLFGTLRPTPLLAQKCSVRHWFLQAPSNIWEFSRLHSVTLMPRSCAGD